MFEVLIGIPSSQNGCQDSFLEKYHCPDASLVVSLIYHGGCRAKQRLPSPTSQ